MRQCLQFVFSFGLGDPLPVAIRLFKLPKANISKWQGFAGAELQLWRELRIQRPEPEPQ
jgi:hypothetical protein